MNFKNFKIGQKLGIGFGALIAISVVLGGLAIGNMLKVIRQTNYLANEYVPEVEIANNLERNLRNAMYANRAFSYTQNDRFYEEGKNYLTAVKQNIRESYELADNAKSLTLLEDLTSEAEQSVNSYNSLLDETAEAITAQKASRQQMDAAASESVTAIGQYISVQNQRMEDELARGRALSSRHIKIEKANEVQNLLNGIRILNFKAQSDRDLQKLREAIGTFDQMAPLFTEIRRYTDIASDIQAVDVTEQAASKYKAAIQTYLNNSENLLLLDQKRNEAADNVLAASQNIVNAGIEGTQGISDETIRSLSNSNIIMIVGLIFALIIGIAFAFIITRAITGPVRQGVSFAEALEKGDLTASVEIDQKDEIGMLAQTLKRMADKIREIVSDVRSGADNIAAASSQLSTASQQVSQGASQQASSAEEVSSSMEEMASNIQQNTENAQQTEKIAEKASKDILDGSESVKQTVTSMKDIAEKVSIIGEIARQTNILALNAAVEAARAGEHGKGFAVVAAEVRKLAERSQAAAAEIDEVSKSSVEVAVRSAELFDSIVPDIQKTAKLVQEITAASIEQNAGADQVNTAIQQLNMVTQQNAASSEEMATSSEELASQADSLKSTIAYFKVDNNGSGHRKMQLREVKKSANTETRPAESHKSNGHYAKDKSNGFQLIMDDDNGDSGFERF